jgi:thiol-disulfide isomerase/thioredoxin
MGRALLAAVVVVFAPVAAVITFILLPFGVSVCLGISVAMVALAFWVLVRFRLVDPQANSLGSLFAGMVSPTLAGALGILSYSSLTRASADRDSDFVFRLTLTVLAMALPCIATLAIAGFARRRRPLGAAGRAGVGLAIASLVLTWIPVNGLIARHRQAQNLALDVVMAPPFDTVDIRGERHRLEDHAGKVILINIWATWCGPCRAEMPQIERLYQSRKENGLMVFGLSTEEAARQRQFAEDVVVSYPLLTVEGNVPETYSQTGRYPANFLIDREGRLRTAPSTDEPFSSLEATVDALLAAPGGDH